jgi:alkylation response protein AidB-like acyl-CoA dehydrogenase
VSPTETDENRFVHWLEGSAMPDLLISSPDDPRLDELCAALAERADALDVSGDWPAEQLELLARYGVYGWFISSRWGGQDWSGEDVVRGELRIASACLTTTFILTQWTGACRRIVASQNRALKDRVLPELAAGRGFTTLGISHLTTSRRHLAEPALRARVVNGGFLLDGYSPWVTGGVRADTVVTGGQLEDGRHVLVLLPTDRPGVFADQPARLVALSGSATGAIRCRGVFVEQELLLAGPSENLLATGGGATGGIQTSTLAVGLATAAVEYLLGEAGRRPDLLPAAEALSAERDKIEQALLAVVAGRDSSSTHELRTRANSLVLRATQAALAAAKGSGYVQGHPAGRWCREALFFLVWSCPQPVMEANLCELAGIVD